MEQEPLSVLLIGALGRLGRHADALLRATPGIQVVARLGRGEINSDCIRATGATVGLEMTAAGQGLAHGLALLEGGVRPVIATSGVSAEDTEALDRRARELNLGGIVVPNFSLGMWLMQRTAAELAHFYPRAEIVETHHAEKRDAPSGSALQTRERMTSASPSADSAKIPIHSLRLPGVLANQEVIFGGKGELLRITHETFGPEAYDAGLLCAVRYAARASGVQRGIEIPFERCGIRAGTLHPPAR